MAAPVKTLRQAIALANKNTEIKTIRLNAGKYDLANGEAFPYAVPAGVKLVGAPGVVFAGTAVETGIVIDTGAIENIQLEYFKIAIRVTGKAQLANITVKKSGAGVSAVGVANLSASGLTFIGTGTENCTSFGLAAHDTARVTVDNLVASDVIAVSGFEQSAITISNGNVAKTHGCTLGLMQAFGKSFVLTDSMLSGGSHGIFLNDTSGLQATLTNTIVANAKTGIVGTALVFDMTNGELRNNSDTGASFSGGTFTFTNVSVKGNPGHGITISSQLAPGTITLRGCSVTENGKGIGVLQGATGDLGTAAKPGNNTIRDNALVGLTLEASNRTSAVGNTWIPGVQGADVQGKYGPQSFTGNLPENAKANIYVLSATLEL